MVANPDKDDKSSELVPNAPAYYSVPLGSADDDEVATGADPLNRSSTTGGSTEQKPHSAGGVEAARTAQETVTAASAQNSISFTVAEMMKNASGLTGASSALKAALAAQETLAAASGQHSASSAVAEMMKNTVGLTGANSVLKAALAAQETLAAASAQNYVSSAMAEMMKNTAGLTGANSALRAALAAQGTLAAAGVANSVSRAMSEIVRNSVGASGLQLGIQSAIRATELPYNASTLAALRAVSAGDISSTSDARFLEGWRDGADAERYFKSVSRDAPARSGPPMLAEEYFSEDEGEVASLADLHVKIERLVAKNPGLALVWRGHQDARWGLHSNLFRALSTDKGKASERYPSEDQMVIAEKEILQTARDEWRLNDMSAVEVFARLQHYGAPTRLIDVSRNPLIAAWFAVEAGPSDSQDGRLIALATGSVPRKSAAFVPSLSISANDLSLGGGPIWHSYSSIEERRTAGWGTGSNRLVWVPSAYEERISAQNAGFVLDGIPIISTEVLPYFRRASGERSLTDGDLLAAGSIFAHTQRTKRKAKRVGPGFAPTFTFRIPKEVKAELRANLASRYSLTRGTIYPDVAGLARYIAADFGKPSR